VISLYYLDELTMKEAGEVFEHHGIAGVPDSLPGDITTAEQAAQGTTAGRERLAVDRRGCRRGPGGFWRGTGAFTPPLFRA